MAAPLLTLNNVLVCPHGGQTHPARPTSRVRIDGAPAVSAATVYTIIGRSLPPGEGGPCVSATFDATSDRIRSGGAALLSADSPEVCLPTRAPLLIDAAQTLVSGG